MTTTRPTIAVCGATGQQGGAVLSHLEADGRWQLRALTRTPDSAEAAAMRQRGIEVVHGDLASTESLRAAFAGVHAVYGVTTPMSPSGKLDVDAELRQGTAIVDACVAEGVAHLVLSTVLLVDDDVTVPYVATKRAVERYAIAQGLAATFLCPSSFMDELGGEYLPLKRGTLTGQADGDARIPYIALDDIGAFASMAFADPERFIGQHLNLVGDFISGDDLASVLSDLRGAPVRHKAPPVLLMRIFAREWLPLRRLFERWGRPPFPTPITDAVAQCRQLRPEVLRFADFAADHPAVVGARPSTPKSSPLVH